LRGAACPFFISNLKTWSYGPGFFKCGLKHLESKRTTK
jgi:hypothetical protein